MPNLLLESARDDVSTGVETDGQTPGVASCGLQYDVYEVVHSRSRCWELLEQAFDDGNNNVRLRNLLVLFLIGSRFHLIFAFLDLFLSKSCCQCCACHWALDCLFLSLRQCGRKGSVAESSNE